MRVSGTRPVLTRSKRLYGRGLDGGPLVGDLTLAHLLLAQIHKRNQDLADPVELLRLRDENVPQTPTKGGGIHRFDPEALERFSAGLTPLLRVTLRVPVRFSLPHDLLGECTLAEAGSIEAVRRLGGTRKEPRDGRLWMSRALARAFGERYPTMVQSVR